jgi:hypothetical protein
MASIHSLQIIGSKTFGGAERWLQRFALELVERGHATELAVRRGFELDADRWQQLPRHSLPMRTVWDPLSRHEVTSLIRRIRPDIVQTYMGRATRLTRLPRGRGPVHVARIGGYYKLDGFRHAHAWIGNTRGICDYLLQNRFPAERVHHIYNFFEPPPQAGEVARRADWGIPETAWVLMTPGRLVPVKGQQYLLQAMSLLPRELGGRPLWLVVLGEGPLGKTLRSQARALGVADRVVWAGWQAEPAPFYRLSDSIVFPSLDTETFGNVILEAWGFGRPLATTAFRGAREIVRHGDDALMSPCEDAPALAVSIRCLCEDAAFAASLAAAGRQRLVRDFSKPVIMQQYIDLYTRLAGG